MRVAWLEWSTRARKMSLRRFLAGLRSAWRGRLVAAAQGKSRDFLVVVGHELRNPLNSIFLCAQMLQRNPDFVGAAAERILAKTRQIDRLISDLLDDEQILSGQVELQRRQCDLALALRGCVEEMAALSMSHRIRMEGSDSLPGRWDADRLCQVLCNLLSNAMKYSPNGGEVVVRLQANPDTIRLSVADEGIGIAPATIPKLFQRFYRAPATARSVRGHGVGLYVCKQLIEAHGGTLSVSSQLGRGSTFIAVVPSEPPAKRLSKG
jgi:chemotaxis family two-component system sensor kinase Cph1